MSAAEAHFPLRRYSPRTARSHTHERSRWMPIWAFFNSSLGLWLLSSVLLTGGVWVFQTVQQNWQQQVLTTQKLEKLNLEIAGRLSQFGTWARLNLLDQQNGHYAFQPGVDEKKINLAIEDLAATPHAVTDVQRLSIHEMFPEFRRRNLLSLYAELSLITRQALEEACECKIGDDQAAAAVLDRPHLRQLQARMAEYREAETALLFPAYLLKYNEPDHDIFIRSFQGVFLTEDTKRSRLPSTDCLENLPNGGDCITYPKSS
jgi:hypothetical protein